MKNLHIYQTSIQKININDVIVSDVTKTLYDYSNREIEINSLMESISTIGQQQPITVVENGSKFIVIDGVLRLLSMKNLNLNSIDSIVCEFLTTDEFSLADLIVHHQIRKQKTNIEKLNEVKSLLRIDSEDKNPLRDKEKRIVLISSLLGAKGWRRNNVFSLENILRWEKETNSTRHLAEKVISNEIPVNRALETIQLIENPLFNKEQEQESKVVECYLKGNYSADKAVNLMRTFVDKKSESDTVVKLYPKDKRNFSFIKGNIEEIDLPHDLQIDTIFTSPPYYRLVKYGDDPNELGWEKTPEEYINRLANILMKCYSKLKSTGSMFVNLGETYKDGQCLGITERLTLEMIKRGVRFVDRIIWKKTDNKPTGNQVKRLVPGYETILFFSKSKDYHFERFRIKSGKTPKVTRGCKEKGSNKRNYHISNQYDQFRNVLNENEVSDILTIQTHRNRTKHVNGEEFHPATFTSNLPVIPLLMATPKKRSSVVFDPFMGSGSCGVTALLLGFKFVGVELYEKNIITANRILSESQEAYDEDSLNSLLDEYNPSEDSDGHIELPQAA
jgi:DNA modification methylase